MYAMIYTNFDKCCYLLDFFPPLQTKASESSGNHDKQNENEYWNNTKQYDVEVFKISWCLLQTNLLGIWKFFKSSSLAFCRRSLEILNNFFHYIIRNDFESGKLINRFHKQHCKCGEIKLNEHKERNKLKYLDNLNDPLHWDRHKEVQDEFCWQNKGSSY